jgi:hypothetical protein
MAESGEVGHFDGFIGPENLLSLVRNTAPWLFTGFGRGLAVPAPSAARLIDLVDAPFGWLQILRQGEQLAALDAPDAAARTDYFALCLACHMATVASFVPTDVDTKIRAALWRDRDPAVVQRLGDAALAAHGWDLGHVSARHVEVAGHGRVGGHDGEWLGVAVGALGAFIRLGDSTRSERFFAAIDAELEREARAFRAVAATPGQELDALRLAAILTHNVGDVDQGLGGWGEEALTHPHHARLRRLAHENAAPYGGSYQRAAALYKQLLSAEGHRHYPLRAVKALRSSPDLLLPFGPFFDDWGRTIASHEALSDAARGEVLAALLAGCRKIAGQAGYFRAIAGMEDGRGLDAFAKHLPGSARQALKDPELRRLVAIKQVSFESTLRKRAQTLLAAR